MNDHPFVQLTLKNHETQQLFFLPIFFHLDKASLNFQSRLSRGLSFLTCPILSFSRSRIILYVALSKLAFISVIYWFSILIMSLPFIVVLLLPLSFTRLRYRIADTIASCKELSLYPEIAIRTFHSI